MCGVYGPGTTTAAELAGPRLTRERVDEIWDEHDAVLERDMSEAEGFRFTAHAGFWRRLGLDLPDEVPDGAVVSLAERGPALLLGSRAAEVHPVFGS